MAKKCETVAKQEDWDHFSKWTETLDAALYNMSSLVLASNCLLLMESKAQAVATIPTTMWGTPINITTSTGTIWNPSRFRNTMMKTEEMYGGMRHQEGFKAFQPNGSDWRLVRNGGRFDNCGWGCSTWGEEGSEARLVYLLVARLQVATLNLSSSATNR